MGSLRVDRDSFIGETYGIGGHLEVVAVSPPTPHGTITYTLKCSVCEKDPEMYGDALFTSSRTNMVSGRSTPCGCARTPAWTTAQYKIKIKRICDELGYVVVGYSDEVIKTTTKVTLYCPEHKENWERLVSSVVASKAKCPKCRNIERMRPDSEMIDEFLSCGKFPDGTIFTRGEGRNMWKYKCGVCSIDEYTEAGVCSGVFSLASYAAKHGILSCRCSSHPHLTQEQQEYRAIKAAGEDVEFLGWKQGFKSGDSVLLMDCPVHGVQESKLTNFLTRQTKCPACTKGGYQTTADLSYFYVMKIVGISGDFTGYGISGSLIRRLYNHKRSLERNGFSIEECRVFKASARLALDTETDVKRSFPLSPQDVSGFRTEATTVEMFPMLLEFLHGKLESCDLPLEYTFCSRAPILHSTSPLYSSSHPLQLTH